MQFSLAAAKVYAICDAGSGFVDKTLGLRWGATGVLKDDMSNLAVDWLELGRLALIPDMGRVRNISSWYLDGIRAEVASSSALKADQKRK